MKQPEDIPTGGKPRVKVCRNGPYLVSGAVPLCRHIIVNGKDGCACEWRNANDIPAKAQYALCRCGKTNNRPFCDGSHVKANFDGTETAGRKPYLEQAERISGPALDLTDAEALCSHAGFCHHAGGIWDLIELSANDEARKTAIREAADCPSGRLMVWDKQGKPIEPAFEPSICPTEEPDGSCSGPLWVRGGIPVESADGTVHETRNRMTLCRCGRSANKPFCDGKHLSP